MEKGYKEAWVDEENRIISFHKIENGRRIRKPEVQFWVWAMNVIRSGYRIT